MELEYLKVSEATICLKMSITTNVGAKNIKCKNDEGELAL